MAQRILSFTGVKTQTLDTDLAYIAGILDGEGFVGICKRLPTKSNRSTTPKYAARVSVSMTDKRPLFFLLKHCGLPASKFHLKSRKRGNERTQWSVDVENDWAVLVVQAVFPFLVMKKPQARFLMELRKMQRPRQRKSRTEVCGQAIQPKGTRAGRVYSLRQRSVAHLDICERLYRACQRLNLGKEGKR